MSSFQQADDGTVVTNVGSSVWIGPFGYGGGLISGFVKPGWEAVRAAFEENYKVGFELGSQLCIYSGTEVVVDLWGKSSDQKQYSATTLQNIFSCGKNMEAICIAVLVDRGLLSYEDLVSKYWPEFGQHGKDSITIADVLRHEGGVPFFSDPNDRHDWKKDKKLVEGDIEGSEKIEKIVEDSGKWDLLGDRHYHSWTRGWILSGVIKRVDPRHRTLGQFMREEVCAPLELDIFCGMSAEEQSNYQIADIKAMPLSYSAPFLIAPAMVGFGEKSVVGAIKMVSDKQNPVRRHTLGHFQKDKSFINTPFVRSCEIPSAGMHGNARSVAKINALMANNGSLLGTTLLSPATVHLALSEPKIEQDNFLTCSYSFSKGGFSRFSDFTGAIVNDDFNVLLDGFWGWGGYGGSLSIWHPEKQVSVAYTMNALTLQGLGGPRTDRILKAIQDVIRRI